MQHTGLYWHKTLQVVVSKEYATIGLLQLTLWFHGVISNAKVA